jgi:hypothetical protein
MSRTSPKGWFDGFFNVVKLLFCFWLLRRIPAVLTNSETKSVFLLWRPMYLDSGRSVVRTGHLGFFTLGWPLGIAPSRARGGLVGFVRVATATSMGYRIRCSTKLTKAFPNFREYETGK